MDVAALFERPPWPHQLEGVTECIGRLEAGTESIAFTSPTGGGKSLCMLALIRYAINAGRRVSLYANRNLLMQQIIGVLEKYDIEHGVRAAQFEDRLALERDVQISSIATELKRVYKYRKWDLHDADLVLMDEAHIQKATGAIRVLDDHKRRGAQVVGFTATPMGINHAYDELIVAGTNSELRGCGALVVAQMYAPDEPDLAKIKPQVTGEYNLNDIRKLIWTPQIFGRVYDHWKRYNPDARPALGFAPGVLESLWFAKQFCDVGVNAAHIDGEDIWVEGKQYKSDPAARADVLARWQAGDIKIVWNRFVMREGIDVPWLYHLILATPVGSMLSYVQIVGRVLRKSVETPEYVVIQDHGGNYWRHGSPNIDRPWAEYWQIPTAQVQNMRMDAMRDKKISQPWVCPACKAVRTRGGKCWKCGYESPLRTREVLQVNGQLKAVHGDILKPRVVKCKPNTQQLWDEIFYASKRAKPSSRNMNFAQAEALFFLTHRYYPPRTLANMPRHATDWYVKIRKLDDTDLITRAEAYRANEPDRKLPLPF